MLSHYPCNAPDETRIHWVQMICVSGIMLPDSGVVPCDKYAKGQLQHHVAPTAAKGYRSRCLATVARQCRSKIASSSA